MGQTERQITKLAGGSAAPIPTSEASKRWQPLVGRLALVSLVAPTAFIAFAGASGRALLVIGSPAAPGWVAGPLRGFLPPATLTGFGVAMLALLVGYVVALATADHLDAASLWVAICAINVLLLLAPPLLSSDVFGYIAYGRLGAVHGLNPYIHPPAAAGSDPVVALVYWRAQTSPYGPLFTAASYPLASLGVPQALWAFKTLAALASMTTAAVIWRASGHRPQVNRKQATVLLSLNPLLLVYGVAGAHIDVAAMLLVACAIATLIAGPTRAAVALVAACAVKIVAAVVLPFALAGTAQRGRTIAVTGVFLALGALITVAVFGTGVFAQATSLATDNRYLIDYSGPSVLGALLGTGPTAAVRGITTSAAAVVALVGLARCRCGRDWLAAAGWTTLAALCVAPTLAPWYVCLLLPMAALSASRRLAVATVLFTVLMVFTHLTLLGRPITP